MNGSELAAKLNSMTIEQLRAVFRAAAAEIGLTPKQAAKVIEFRELGGSNCAPEQRTHELVWLVYMERRIFTPTGRRVWSKTYTFAGGGQWVNETTCDWSQAEAAVARALAAGRA